TGCLLDARLKDHASFAWKGLHATLQELRSGFSWAPSYASPPSRILLGGHDSVYWCKGGASVRIPNSLNFPCLFSLMGDRTNCFSFLFFGSADSFSSRWCESRSRPSLGRRLVRLERSSIGHRQPCHLRCQVLVWCFASDDWYGVRGSFVLVFSDEVDGFSDWFSAGAMERNNDDGSIVRGVVISFGQLKVPFWEVLMMDGESGSVLNSGFSLLVLKRQGWFAGRIVIPFNGCMVAGLSSEGYHWYVGLKIGGRIVEGWAAVYISEGVGVWLSWRECSDSEGVWKWPRWSVWCVLGGVWPGLGWSESYALQRVWVGSRWRYRRRNVRFSSLMGLKWWLWRISRGSTAESMGRGKVAGKVIGNVGLSCMARVERACTWVYSRKGLGPTGSLFSGFVVQWGTFAWVCEVAGLAGGMTLPSGARGRSQHLVIRCVLWSRLQGLVRCVLGICFCELKRCVLGSGNYKLIRCVLEVDDKGNCDILGEILVISKRRVLKDDSGRVIRDTGRFASYLEEGETVRFGGLSAKVFVRWCGSVVSLMADEVARLMSNLKFSEEELIEMESMEGTGQEQQPETEKWVVAKLFTMRKFGEWLRVPLIRKRNSFQGVKRQGIVYTDKEMGGVGIGKQPEGNMQAALRSGGRGQQGNAAHIRSRGPKRVLQGKYEVCTPVGTKKARSASSSLVIEDDGNLEVVSPLKTTSTVEAMEQPHREP
ncbi:hypothetical protein V6N12_009741, partial [Hibiscus sabdariffa]